MGLGRRKSAGCFLIGSGPSLKKVDVARLAYVDTIGFNRSYVAWNQWGFFPTYYACLDTIVLEDNVLEIQKLIEEYSDTHFFLSKSAKVVGITSLANVSLVELTSGSMFSKDIFTLTDFGNVGATSIQILALLGYRRIAMIGIDARYTPVDERLFVPDKNGFVFVADDPNHFCAEYVQGKRLNARPNLKKILGHWPQVARECANNEIEVRNASPGSALECFPKIDFADAMEWVSCE